MVAAPEQLHVLHEVARRLGAFTDLDELLRYATRRAREVFEAEGCALLLYDAARGEFYFPIASQSASRRSTEARLADIRFPADRGIAGWVLRTGEATVVHDVEKDPRFYRHVDEATSMHTATLLCAPLRTDAGAIGVIEVVNPARPVTTDDLTFLETLATDIAIAHERAALHERLRGEVGGLRQVCRLGGVGLMIVGALLAAGAGVSHFAWALPARELIVNPGMLAGIVAFASGGALVAIAQGWLIGHTHPPDSGLETEGR